MVGCSDTHARIDRTHFVLTQFLKIWPMDKTSRAEGKLVCQMAAENACRRLEIGAAQTWHDLFSAFVSDNWTWDQLEEEPPWKLQKCPQCWCSVGLDQFEVQVASPDISAHFCQNKAARSLRSLLRPPLHWRYPGLYKSWAGLCHGCAGPCYGCIAVRAV